MGRGIDELPATPIVAALGLFEQWIVVLIQEAADCLVGVNGLLDGLFLIAGERAEIWRELSGITVAKLEVHGKTHLKLSHITPYAHKLLTLCRAPSLETILSE